MSVIHKPLLGPEESRPCEDLIVEGLRQNNLKNITVAIPHDRITAVVGPSGSGKSSLAFETLFAEGRWRFMESLSTYTRLFLDKMERPDMDAIRNIRPAIAVEQKNPVRTSRSTVGTASEVNDYIRLIFSRIGRLYCPRCNIEISPDEPTKIAGELISRFPGRRAVIGFVISLNGKSYKKGANEAIESLMARGFSRVRVKGKTYDLNEKKTDLQVMENLDVVMDRVVLKKTARDRLTESLENAYMEGGEEAWVAVEGEDTKRFRRRPLCRECGLETPRPTPLALSFNHPVGACPECRGFGNVLLYDEGKIIPDKTLSLRQGAIAPWTKPSYRWLYEELEETAPSDGIDLDVPYQDLPKEIQRLIHEGAPNFHGIDEFFAGLEKKQYKLHIKVFTSRYKSFSTCTLCEGRRLSDRALNLIIGGKNIAQINAMAISEARDFFYSLKLGPMEKKISGEAIRQVVCKLDFLFQTGLGYIALSRATKTLSGGEIQRVTLATQLASTLTGVLYVLDEPSVGLHPVDIEAIKGQMEKLRSRGNTIVVVEHDHEIIRNSDYIVELGPGAGTSGGRLVFTGDTVGFLKKAQTLTSKYLTGRLSIPVPRWRRQGNGRSISLEGASGNNLKEVNVRIPLKTLTCVTGVSGSGKSTLIIETLYRALAGRFNLKSETPLPFTALHGAGDIRGLTLIGQSPIGRSHRSIPATFIGAFASIRKAFASEPSARSIGCTPGDFSFNVPGGRCEKCGGEGARKLDMYFLPDVYIKCPACEGRRFNRKTLSIKYRGKSIGDVLGMSFDEAARLFRQNADLKKKFGIMAEVGLGYLRLGQPAPRLSGGEAQRIKIARELLKGNYGERLFILDEPTRGLHTDDIKKLLSLLGRLVDSGNTVLIIEHNMEVIKTADHIIDMGPGGGPEGGSIVCSGTPEAAARTPGGKTGAFLLKALSI